MRYIVLFCVGIVLGFWHERIVDGLAWIGLVRRRPDGTVRWPIDWWPLECWKLFISHPFDPLFGWFCVFRNRPGVVKWEKGRLLPRRWGFRILGLEIGDRG